MWTMRIATGLMLSLLLVAAGARAEPAGELPLLRVWKSPTCGCCGKWVEHMQAAGFRVQVTDIDNLDPIKTANGVPLKLASCHTARLGGYVVEGHVPASDVKRLLKDKPDILGLTAPGMPAGSPGMDVPGSPPYEVLALDKDGKTTVYAIHSGNN